MTQFRHVGIVVEDIEASLRIWTEGLNFQVVSRRHESGTAIEKLVGIKDVSLESVKLASDKYHGVSVEFLSFRYPNMIRRQPPCAPNSFGITHVALTVNNLHSILEALGTYGVRVLGEVSLSEDGSSRGVYTEFPENILVELVEVLRS